MPVIIENVSGCFFFLNTSVFLDPAPSCCCWPSYLLNLLAGYMHLCLSQAFIGISYAQYSFITSAKAVILCQSSGAWEVRVRGSTELLKFEIGVKKLI